jgi:hypothetical protein
VNHAQLTVGANDAVVEAPRPAIGDGRGQDPRHAVAIVGVHLLDVGAVGTGLAVGANAVDPVELVGPRDAVGDYVPLPGTEARDLLGLRELGLVGPQARLRLVALGHVEQLADVVQRLAALVAHERRAEQRDDGKAVAVAHARFDLEGVRRAQRLRYGGVLDDVLQRELEELGLAAPEQAAERGVGAQEAAVRRDERQAERRIAKRAREAVHEVGLAIGDVVADRVDEPRLAVERRPRLRPPLAAVGSGEAKAERRERLAVLHDLVERSGSRLVVALVDDVPERAREVLLLGQPGLLAGGGVDADDRPVPRGDDQRLADELEEPPLAVSFLVSAHDGRPAEVRPGPRAPRSRRITQGIGSVERRREPDERMGASIGPSRSLRFPKEVDSSWTIGAPSIGRTSLPSQCTS